MPTLTGRLKTDQELLPQTPALESSQQSAPQGHGASRGMEAAAMVPISAGTGRACVDVFGNNLPPVLGGGRPARLELAGEAGSLDLAGGGNADVDHGPGGALGGCGRHTLAMRHRAPLRSRGVWARRPSACQGRGSRSFGPSSPAPIGPWHADLAWCSP